MKCIECGTRDIETIEKDGREFYRCVNGHLKPRMIENEGLQTFTEDGETIHRSVGAIVVKDEKVLLLNRRKYPYLYSIPAGHLEEGEKPGNAVSRELEEETGIRLEPGEFQQVFEGTIDDPCRRGADRHHWNLYVAEIDGSQDMKGNDESEALEWLPVQKLEAGELTEPTEKFLLEKNLAELE